MISIKRFSSRDADFSRRLDALLAFESAQDESIDRTVAAILADVKVRGDAAGLRALRRAAAGPGPGGFEQRDDGGHTLTK